MTTNKNKNGGLFTYTHFNNKVVGIVSLSCETDFAEKTDVFKKLGMSLAEQVACSDSENIDSFLNEIYIYFDSAFVKDIIEETAESLKEKINVLKIEKIEF